ncbi:MAG: histidine kinase [Campylobacterales bacterium]|nr:histidine kinase [Campylobacterales bacterium]
MNELKITLRDWFGIGITGILFSSLLSVLGYHLLSLPWVDGAVFGVTLGSLITLFSFLFVTSMNRYILPRIPTLWWNAVAALFSFASGFLGVLSSHFLLTPLPIRTVGLFHTHPLVSASIVGGLTYLLGRLMYRIVSTRNLKEQSERLFVRSRLSSLDTQLNPHFLFNSLNSLSELVHQDPAKAEEALLKLSRFLRNTMKERSLIPLSEELRNVRDYLELENIRFQGSLVLQTDLPAELQNIPVPKFSIQLIAENAVKHGFVPNASPFIIRVAVTHSDKTRIRVSNTGKAISNATFGIGLANLKERLEHLCGGDVWIESFDPPAYLIELKECHEHFDRR